MTILSFGKQQEIWEVEQHRREIFPVRRLSGGSGWREQNASLSQPGGPIRSDGGRGRQTATQSQTAEPGRGQSTQRQSVQILAAVPHLMGGVGG